ncbi:MAG: mechanosensitive ion channel family protein [Acidimicrobiales bacterium]
MKRTPLLLQLAQQSDSETELSNVLGTGLTAADWLAAGGIFVGSILVARVAQSIASRLLKRQDADDAVVRFVSHIVRNVVVLAGLVYALVTLQVRMGPLLGAVGIGGLAVAFAAQSILENTFASILLRTRRPFRRGDEITTGSHSGTVMDVNFRTVVIRTYAGERVLVPCALVLGEGIVNHTVNGSRRSTLTIGVAYSTDLRHAQQLLVDAASAVAGVRQIPPVEAWVEEFADSSINFALRYWHNPDRATLWKVRSDVAIAVKTIFDANGVTIPFPQRVVGFVSTPTDGAGDAEGPGPSDG